MSATSPRRKKRRSPSGGENTTMGSSESIRQEEGPDARGIREAREVIESRRYEYLDHPADIQLHSWGDSLERAVEALMVSMYGYMTDLSRVEEVYPYHFSGQGHDMETMLFSFMEEALCAFQSEPFFVAKRFVITKLDCENFHMEGVGYGESYDLERKHSQEADIKAITYSNMQITCGKTRSDIYVIVDI